NRNPSYATSLTAGGDTTLVRDLRVSRDMALDVEARPDEFLSMLGVAPGRTAEGLAGAVRDVWDRLRPVRIGWSRAVEASYDRRDIDPSLADHLVVESFKSLRFMTSSDTAASAAERNRFQLRGGIELPWSLDGELEYSKGENTTYT